MVSRLAPGVAPPSTIVPADDRIFAPSGHGAVWLGLGVLALVAGVGLIGFATRPLWSRRSPPVTAIARAKARSLGRLDEITAGVAAGGIDARAAHHQVSRTLRQFAVDLGAAGAPAMSTTALRAAGFDPVARAVGDLQVPQFHPTPHADVLMSIGAARDVIAEWPEEPTLREVSA
jgi:hypothetical protein